MEELKIYFMRHGQSEGNLDRKVYVDKADHAVLLAPNGHAQADSAGAFLAERFSEEQDKNPESFGRIRVWHSSYYRARQTAFHVLQQLGKKFDPHSGILTWLESPLLIEQKGGLFDDKEAMASRTSMAESVADYAKHTSHSGQYYADVPLGDSRLGVAFRAMAIFDKVRRDYERGIRHVVMINHGVTLRALVGAWMRYPPEWMDSEKTPGNCWARYIHGIPSKIFVDDGYVYGEKAPLHDPTATQKQLPGADGIVMLKPYRPNILTPPGVKLLDPFQGIDPK